MSVLKLQTKSAKTGVEKSVVVTIGNWSTISYACHNG